MAQKKNQSKFTPVLKLLAVSSVMGGGVNCFIHQMNGIPKPHVIDLAGPAEFLHAPLSRMEMTDDKKSRYMNSFGGDDDGLPGGDQGGLWKDDAFLEGKRMSQGERSQPWEAPRQTNPAQEQGAAAAAAGGRVTEEERQAALKAAIERQMRLMAESSNEGQEQLEAYYAAQGKPIPQADGTVRDPFEGMTEEEREEKDAEIARQRMLTRMKMEQAAGGFVPSTRASDDYLDALKVDAVEKREKFFNKVAAEPGESYRIEGLEGFVSQRDREIKVTAPHELEKEEAKQMGKPKPKPLSYAERMAAAKSKKQGQYQQAPPPPPPPAAAAAAAPAPAAPPAPAPAAPAAPPPAPVAQAPAPAPAAPPAPAPAPAPAARAPAAPAAVPPPPPAAAPKAAAAGSIEGKAAAAAAVLREAAARPGGAVSAAELVGLRADLLALGGRLRAETQEALAEAGGATAPPPGAKSMGGEAGAWARRSGNSGGGGAPPQAAAPPAAAAAAAPPAAAAAAPEELTSMREALLAMKAELAQKMSAKEQAEAPLDDQLAEVEEIAADAAPAPTAVDGSLEATTFRQCNTLLMLHLNERMTRSEDLARLCDALQSTLAIVERQLQEADSDAGIWVGAEEDTGVSIGEPAMPDTALEQYSEPEVPPQAVSALPAVDLALAASVAAAQRQGAAAAAAAGGEEAEEEESRMGSRKGEDIQHMQKALGLLVKHRGGGPFGLGRLPAAEAAQLEASLTESIKVLNAETARAYGTDSGSSDDDDSSRQ